MAAGGLCGPLLMWLMAFSHGLFLRLKLSPPWQLALGGDRRAAVF
jgi:CIC family chloride channel protein